MLLSNLNLLATAPGGVARLRELILTLAVQGKLVPRNPKDEPASALLKKIRAEKDRLITDGKIKRDRPLPEIADEETPSGLPPNWEWVRFGELLDFQGGGQPPKSNFSDIPLPDYVQLIQIRDLGSKPQPVFIPRTLASKFCTSSDVMVGRYGASVGKVFWGKDGAYNVALVKMVDEHHAFDRGFLFQFLLSPLGQSLFSGISRSAQDGFNKNDIEAKLIPLAPLAEQSRVVTRVEELMRLCDALESKGQLEATQHAQLVSTLLGTLTDSETPAQLADNWQRIATHFDLLLDRPEAVDAMEQTILQLAVRGLLSTHAAADAHVEIGDRENSPVEIPPSWSHVSFEDVLLELRYGTSVKCGYEVIGTPVLRIPNLKSGRVDTTDLKFGVLDEREKEKLRLELGDLLIIRSNGSVSLVGSAALVSAESEGFAFAGYLVRARFKREYVEPTYLVLVMQTLEIRAQIEAPIRTTSGVKNINSTEISRLAFALPPLTEQSRIVTRVAQLRRLCADLRQRLTASQSTQTKVAESLIASV